MRSHVDSGLSRYRNASVMAALLLCCSGPVTAGIDDVWAASPATNDSAWAQANAAPVNPGNSGSSDTRVWYNMLSQRANGATYYNTTGRNIIVAVGPTGNRWEQLDAYVNGIYFGRVYSGDFGGGAVLTMEVTFNGSYRVSTYNHRGQGHGIQTWNEFR